MAYPLARALTFFEFKKLLGDKFGCKYKELADVLIDDQGKSHTVHYFERGGDGNLRTAVCQGFADNEVLTFSAMRSIATRLGIRPQELGVGLDLG